ncbi:MAG: IPT/TIG domain-containing protein [Candidatus Obscuribacterales bacterium]|nr:IPT/TIG domain-containing protein [Candidatus Obscuribacterales bacterium]
MKYLGSAQRLMASLLATSIAISVLASPCLAAKGHDKDNAKGNKISSSKKANLIAQAAKANQEFSPALISVLKDISKALPESSDYNNLSDAKQKAVAGLAINVLQTALSNPQLTFNRIISAEDKAKAENSMSAETWDSGEIVVRQGNDPQGATTHAVASCIWAKKANGLLNLTIAGNSNEIVDGQKLGEFIFVVSGRSGIESGFDIQSQTGVNYWIGKLSQFVADTAGMPTSQISAQPEQTVQSTARATQAPSEPAENVSTPAAEATPEEKKDTSEPKSEAPINKSSTAETTTPIATKPIQVDTDGKAPRRSYLLLKAPSLKKTKAETKPQTKAEAPSNELKQVTETTQIAQTTNTSTIQPQAIETKKEEVVVTTTQESQSTPTIQEATTETIVKETVAMAGMQPKRIVPQVEVGPSLDAILVTPDKAQAGQLITISVVNARLVPESGVDVEFNGTVLTTGATGQIQYLVPEDSTPGPTLKVAIAGRQLATTKVVHILQPLSTPSEPQQPHVDRVTNNASKFDTVTIQGHNFTGQAGNLIVTIDGKWDAQILSTSPLELKILVPEDVPAGQHSISVTNAGLKSNAALFSLISLQVAPDARPGQVPTKLIVRALGTAKPVAVHLRNNTPNIITIVKGNDLRIKTPGGKDNSIAVSVRLKQRGNYNIQASIE